MPIYEQELTEKFMYMYIDQMGPPLSSITINDEKEITVQIKRTVYSCVLNRPTLNFFHQHIPNIMVDDNMDCKYLQYSSNYDKDCFYNGYTNTLVLPKYAYKFLDQNSKKIDIKCYYLDFFCPKCFNGVQQDKILIKVKVERPIYTRLGKKEYKIVSIGDKNIPILYLDLPRDLYKNINTPQENALTFGSISVTPMQEIYLKTEQDIVQSIHAMLSQKMSCCVPVYYSNGFLYSDFATLLTLYDSLKFPSIPVGLYMYNNTSILPYKGINLEKLMKITSPYFIGN